ncbi:TPA: hypothetical protein ACOJP0_005076 [Vibrio harveyi]
MRIYLTCMDCHGTTVSARSNVYSAELQDSGCYSFTCSQQHESTVKLKNPKFEILFELGLNAIHDGYYREAVSSFTSSLERFYEYVINILYRSAGINLEQTSQLWKLVSNQSERQFGAYLFVYQLVEKKIPPQLSNKCIKFRNEVIHKGKIPSRIEAIEYGEAILTVISPVLKVLVEKYDPQILELMREQLNAIDLKLDVGKSRSTMSINTTVSALRGNDAPPNLCSSLERIAFVRSGLSLL